MGEFIYFTQEQKERANAVAIIDILNREQEEVEKAGNEWRWKRHKSVTFRGNQWYRHSQQIGSHAIAFMQEFFGMTYPEAVTYLLNGETGKIIRGKQSTNIEQQNGKREHETKRKQLVVPRKNNTMKRIYAYLLSKRHISREILSYFAKKGTLYESEKYHNVVFVGLDKEGNVRHIHQRGSCSDGKSFRMNEEGSDAAYGFGHVGNGNMLYVFEAPIDLLSFLTLYPKNWQESSYIVLNGVAEHAMMQMLKDYPYLDTIVLCLDHDGAGIEACGRLAEHLMEKGYRRIKMLQPTFKDWNEDLKKQYGEEVLPAQEHPKVSACEAWMAIVKKVAESIDNKYATKNTICRYYQDIYEVLIKGHTREHLETAFDDFGMLLTGVLVRCIEGEAKALGKDIDIGQILDCLQKRYRPHQDKGNYATRLRNMQKVFTELMEVYDSKDLTKKDNKELLIKKWMSLAMECIKAHLFVAVDYQEAQMGKEMKMICSQ